MPSDIFPQYLVDNIYTGFKDGCIVLMLRVGDEQRIVMEHEIFDALVRYGEKRYGEQKNEPARKLPSLWLHYFGLMAQAEFHSSAFLDAPAEALIIAAEEAGRTTQQQIAHNAGRLADAMMAEIHRREQEAAGE